MVAETARLAPPAQDNARPFFRKKRETENLLVPSLASLQRDHDCHTNMKSLSSVKHVRCASNPYRDEFFGVEISSISVGTSSMLWRMAPVFSTLSVWLGGCFQLIFVVPLLILLLARADGVSVNRSQEVSALLNFRDANDGTTYGGYWVSWKETDETPCDWFGVTCTENLTVEQLDLSGWWVYLFSLKGLYNLPSLRLLDLSSNNIEESLDILGIGTLTALTQLDLSSSGAYGAVPSSISACQNLRFLALENNSLTALPLSMRDLVNLKSLSLAGNNFTGPFPTDALGNLSSLASLDLSRNSFNGSIPSLPNLTSLVVLKLDYNSFTGFEESWFLGAETLQYLSVSSNYLQGDISANITNLQNLTFVNMSGNSLSGPIPRGFSRLISQPSATLDLSQNQLMDGIPPDILVTIPSNPNYSYTFINLSYNRLTGNIPVDGSQPLTVSVLDLSHNNLSGLPSNIFNNANSSVLSFELLLNDNQLSGDIVDVFFSDRPGLRSTRVMKLQNNLFTGDLSRLVNRSLSLFYLEELDLSNNNLQWSTSEVIRDPIAAVLQVLTNYSQLQVFRAGGNNFSGTPLPAACFVYNSNFTDLAVFDLINSHLHGQILGAAFDNTCLPSIQLLNLSNNHATGPLSESVINHQQGFIIDISNNSLSGLLPVIQPSSDLYNPKYFAGNDGLCGGPLPPCARKTDLEWWVLLIIIGASVTIVSGSCFVASWRLRGYRKQHQQDADLIRTLLERDSATLMSLRELKKATNNFADNAQIGEGGFGTVYTGRLNDGTRVAIKRSKREGSENDKAQFLNEVRILSQVSHRNLVKLLGCCMENKIALLVFEFISNGTLQEHLQGKLGPVRLTWKQRLHIAVQTADALHYLHSMASSPIYHRDVKSANILLDENLNAKVADFGISKLAPLHATHVSTVAIQGTMGYIDPDYYTSYQLTDKSDVYSFGVVLLELISAKAALDLQRGGEEASLVYFARPYIERGNLEGFTDPALLSDMYSDDGCKSMILTVGKIAMKCVDVRAKSRPSMYDVLKELENLLDDHVSTSKHVDSSINEEASEDLQSDEICLLFDTSSTNSFSFVMQGGGNGLLFDTSSTNSSSFVMQGDGNGIQMTQTSGPLSFKRGSMRK